MVELGFGKSPARRRVHVNQQYSDCLWYFWNGADKVHIPILENNIFCIIEEIAFRVEEFKGKDQDKIDIHVKADKNFTLTAGIDTSFSKSIVSALNCEVFDLSQPVSIYVKAGDSENVIFASVYQEGKKAEIQYLDTIDKVLAASDAINRRLGVLISKSASKEIWKEAESLGWKADELKASLASLGIDSLYRIPTEKESVVKQLIKSRRGNL